MRKLMHAVGCLIAAGAIGGCAGSYYESPAAQYVQRSDKITLGAGNAKDINAATHVIDPWPRYVGDRRIPGHGERMVNAIDRYRTRPAATSGGQQPSQPAPAGAGMSVPSGSAPSGAANPL